MSINKDPLPNINQIAQMARASIEPQKTHVPATPPHLSTAASQQSQKPFEVLKGVAKEIGMLCLAGLKLGSNPRQGQLVIPLLSLSTTAKILLGGNGLKLPDINAGGKAILANISAAVFTQSAATQLMKAEGGLTRKELMNMSSDELHAVDLSKVTVAVLNDFLSLSVKNLLNQTTNATKFSDKQLGELMDREGISKVNLNKIANAWGGDYKGPKFAESAPRGPMLTTVSAPKIVNEEIGFNHTILATRLDNHQVSQHEVTQLLKDYTTPGHPIQSGGVSNRNLEKLLKLSSPADLNRFLQLGGAKKLSAFQAHDLLDASILSNHALYRKIDQENIPQLLNQLDSGRSKIFMQDAILDIFRNSTGVDFEQMSPVLLNRVIDSIGAKDILTKEVIQNLIDSRSNEIDPNNLAQLKQWLAE